MTIKNVRALLLETENSWQMLSWTATDTSIQAYKQLLMDKLSADFSNVKLSINPFNLKLTKDKMAFEPLKPVVHSRTMDSLMKWEISLKPDKDNMQNEWIIKAHPWRDIKGIPTEPAGIGSK